MKKQSNNENNINWDPVSLIELDLSDSLSDIIPQINEGIYNLRHKIVDNFGFIPCSVPVLVDKKLRKNKYRIKLEDLEIAAEDVMPDLFFAIGPQSCLTELKGLEAASTLEHKGIWISSDAKERAISGGCVVYSPADVIVEHLRIVLFKNVHRLLGLEQTQQLLNTLKITHPVMVEELIPKVFSLLELRRILKRLLLENVSLRPLINIMETLADYSHLTTDSDQLTEYVRQSLGSYICKDYKDEKNNIYVITSDTRMERIFLKGIVKSEKGVSLELDPEIRRKLRESVREHIEKFNSRGLRPIVLSSPEARLHLKRFCEKAFPDLVILSLDEIPPGIKTTSLGILSVEDAEAYINSGDQYYRENKLELAESEYRRAVELDPANAKAHYALRLTYRKMGKLELALNAYKKAIELDPKYEFVDLEFKKDDIQEPDLIPVKSEQTGADDIEIVVPGDKPKPSPVPKIEENVYIDQERIEKMKILNPSFATIFNKMGEDYLALENYESAQKEFIKALELSPNYAAPHLNLGIIYFHQQDWYMCRRELEKALELNTEYLEAYLYLGKLFKLRNMKDKAEQAFYRGWEIANKFSNMEIREEIKKELEQLKS